jgi:hypothetical protein
MSTRSLMGLCGVSAVVAILCAGTGPDSAARAQVREAPASAKPEEDAAAKNLRKKRLDDMRQLADGAAVFRLAGGEKTPAKLAAEPVLRYSGEFHGILDATMWIYGGKGRPVAVEKMELMRTSWHRGYLHCMASLCDDLIEVRWTDYPGWSSKKPGVEFLALPDGPKPVSAETARTRQFKEVARRFSATRIDAGNIREENRLLTQPVYRYRDPDSGIQDGAIFAFIANGTNPDFLLLVELRGTDAAQATWHYGAARMTTGELHLRLDGKEVWSVPWQCVPGRNEYPTYIHFPLRQEPGL